MIFFNEQSQTFVLKAANFDYRVKVINGYLAHEYSGKAVPDEDMAYRFAPNFAYSPADDSGDKLHFLNNLPLEYPCAGIGDFREPSLHILNKNGMTSNDLRYESHRIYAGKPKLKNLPATFANDDEADTVEIVLVDKPSGIEATLLYTAFKNLPVISRSARVKNIGEDSVTLLRALSLCLDIENTRLDMITLSGMWARECEVQRQPLKRGKHSVGSIMGKSSAEFNPFLAIVDRDATEETGEVFGFSFVYSGNWIGQAEVNHMDRARVVMGINPYDFAWKLDPGEAFQTPEVILNYSCEGIGKMSRQFHDLYRNHLIPKRWALTKRPVQLNNWEGTYFDFTMEKLLSIARVAAEVGVEMFVLDDGWFGKRDNDKSGLGDWFVNETKLLGGIKHLADEINAMGLKFGLWFEPEMVNPDSDLYRAHPDWCIHVPERIHSQSRNQLVLDFSRGDVRKHIYGMIKDVLSSANIEYVKWDMNRTLSEVGSAAAASGRQRETWHRFVLGVYEMMERLTSDFPELLLENCSSGGGRFDPGMLFYSPQIWASDDSDAIERVKIQHGHSLVYPVSTLGSHVSAVPNHQVGRVTPLKTRGHVALMGAFGYELDASQFTNEEKEQVRAQIEEYHRYCHLPRTGDLYRLGNPFEEMYDAWVFVSKDKNEAILQYIQILARPSCAPRIIKLKGLDPDKTYKIEQTGQVLSGAALMNAGIYQHLTGDFESSLLRLTTI
ncbi:MAG: alpha-galactosidase [Clostridiales bacterium]|jgi:alpha-galactosidase|nr:alpha-galactosidase [Clostridiales bacterium]